MFSTHLENIDDKCLKQHNLLPSKIFSQLNTLPVAPKVLKPNKKNMTGFAVMDPRRAHEIQMMGAKASADARRGKTAAEFNHKKANQ